MPRKATLTGFGGFVQSLEFYRELPSVVQGLVDAAGFGTFVQVLTTPIRNNHALLTALVERWWDTTNTFHLPHGEMTIMPLDFAAITGLRVGDDPIPFDMGLANDDVALQWFLGFVPRVENGSIMYASLRRRWNHDPASDEEAEQMAKAYLLYLFCASLFLNRHSRVHVSFLPALQHLQTIGCFDWGGSALAACHSFIGAASRGVSTAANSFGLTRC
ncbi:protein MAIN-LIKE 1-like [Rhododendron vialii]|uniref:protein MAIN-LIKE 1-like n=1 Tax=Rhododendron vialii TaxID=182163 RepID=UPI00265FD838|nr:protein MAIN-LIKE 1-like [Rhododendron vialii]